MVARLKDALDVEIVAGNVATAEAAEALAEAGADGVKCRRRAGLDLHDAGRRRRRSAADHCHLRRAPSVASRTAIPCIADGGITCSGDIAKAVAAGADTVMLGALLAGTDEAPGDVVLDQGERFKEFRGMGSLGAMKARGYSKDRYFQGDVEDSREARCPKESRGASPTRGRCAR